MDFSRFMDEIIFFAQNHMVIVMVVALGLLFFLYHKPKLFFVLLFLGLFLAGVLCMITNLLGSGSEQKKRLIREDKKQSYNIP